MSKLRFVVLILVLVMVCGGSLVIASQDGKPKNESLCIPIGTITLSAPEGVESKKAAVAFPHSRHFSYKCQECHHTWEMDADLSGCMTSGCHDLAQAPSPSTDDEAIRYYKKAFHSKCIGCHQEIKKQNRAAEKQLRIDGKNTKIAATGPTGCNQCHAGE